MAAIDCRWSSQLRRSSRPVAPSWPFLGTWPRKSLHRILYRRSSATASVNAVGNAMQRALRAVTGPAAACTVGKRPDRGTGCTRGYSMHSETRHEGATTPALSDGTRWRLMFGKPHGKARHRSIAWAPSVRVRRWGTGESPQRRCSPDGDFCHGPFCHGLFCHGPFCHGLFCHGLFCHGLFCHGLFCHEPISHPPATPARPLCALCAGGHLSLSLSLSLSLCAGGRLCLSLPFPALPQPTHGRTTAATAVQRQRTRPVEGARFAHTGLCSMSQLARTALGMAQMTGGEPLADVSHGRHGNRSSTPRPLARRDPSRLHCQPPVPPLERQGQARRRGSA